MISTAQLPDDATQLKALVIAQQVQLAERDAEIERLKLILAELQRMQFGRRSEQLDETIKQLELSLEELEAVRAERTECAEPAAAEGPASDAAPARRPARKPLPDHLPRETVEHAPADCCCPNCGGADHPLHAESRNSSRRLILQSRR
jgi:hypothetical protein